LKKLQIILSRTPLDNPGSYDFDKQENGTHDLSCCHS